jgi:hypothetical protein
VRIAERADSRKSDKCVVRDEKCGNSWDHSDAAHCLRQIQEQAEAPIRLFVTGRQSKDNLTSLGGKATVSECEVKQSEV